MSDEIRIFAWARPIDAPLAKHLGEHTFVTDYVDSYVGNPPPRSWHCAGGVESSDAAGVRQVARTEASARLADRICEPNNPQATAGIVYLKHGTCHQIANRVLFSGVGCTEHHPIVDQAQGYFVSMMLYGHYGTNESVWRDEIEAFIEGGA